MNDKDNLRQYRGTIRRDIDDDLWFAIVNKASKLIGTYNWGTRNDITKGSTHYHADYV